MYTIIAWIFIIAFLVCYVEEAFIMNNIEENKQEKMLETIIFTSTENNLIEEVYLFINSLLFIIHLYLQVYSLLSFSLESI